MMYTHHLGTGTQRLLTENMLSSLNSLNSLLGVHGRSGCNNNGLEGLLLG